jgi:hypothetical protein
MSQQPLLVCADVFTTTFDDYANTPWLWRYETDASELWFALNRVGEFYTRAGDGEKAGAAYARLGQLWRRADSELQRLVPESKIRVER